MSMESLLLSLHTSLQNLTRKVPPKYFLDLDCSLNFSLVFTFNCCSKLSALNQVRWLHSDGDAILFFLVTRSLLVGENNLAIDATLAVDELIGCVLLSLPPALPSVRLLCPSQLLLLRLAFLLNLQFLLTLFGLGKI